MQRFALLAALAMLIALALYLARPEQRSPGEPLGATPSEAVPGSAAILEAGGAEAQVQADPAPTPARVGVTTAPEVPVENPGTMTVHGTVSDLTGTLLPDAKVWTWDVETECDERGEYVLKLTSIGHQPSVFASAPGHVELEQAFTFPVGERSARVDVRLGPAFRVHGRVVDAHGQPIEGAAVKSFYSRKGVATSALDGTFLLDHLDPGRDAHLVYARKGGYVEGKADVRTQGLSVEGLELVLLRGTPVEGYVLGLAGEALEDVALFIGFSRHAYDRLDAKTDSRGAFVFPNVGAGKQTLVAQLAGRSPVKLEIEVPAEPPGLPALELRMAPAHWLGGVVRDAAGAPLVGISISGQQDGEYLDDVRAQTGEDGRFRIEGLPGTGAGIELYGTNVIRKDVRLQPPQLDRADLEVVLERAAIVGGVVIDAATRRPIERFSVHFIDAALEPGDQQITGYSAQWIREGVHFTRADGEWTSAQDELHAGSIAGIEVRAEGYAPARHRRVVARVDFEPRELVFELAPGGSVVGLVLDAADVPVVGAQVFASPAGEPVRRGSEDQYRSGYATTGVGGRFALSHVPAGATKLTVFAAEAPTAIDGPFEVVAGAEVARTVRFGRGSVLEGRTLESSGAPVAGVTVRIVELDASGRRTSQVRTSRTDAAGGFRFSSLTPARYLVTQLQRDDAFPVLQLETTVDVAPESVTSVLLQPTGVATIEGRVLLPDGTPAPPLHVQATFVPLQDGATKVTPPAPVRGTIARDGAFRLDALDRGRWSVRATLRRDGGALTATVEVDVADAPRAPVELRLK